MSEPKRTGLMELLRSSTGCQFVIPVYQRNYTWSADREVKQLLTDLTQVLTGNYKNHFLGILIYLEKSIDFSARELSIIDGQQRLTTIFLIIYAVKDILKREGEDDKVKQLEGLYLTNPYSKDKIKYKLKPLVADDNVYRCIVEDRMADIGDPSSTVLKNYNYICSYLKELVAKGYTANDILLALDNLYVVCVPISEADNAQKIFESINATGIKLTAADLIRNFLLMNLDSESQDKYYASYWKKIEDNVSTDSRILEMFFRMYLAIKTYTLVPKSGVYRSFVDWVNAEGISIDALFTDLRDYSKIFYYIESLDIALIDRELQNPLIDFRKINSDLPISIVMEFYKLFLAGSITAATLSQLISSINAYLIRRSICDMDSQNISRLFPTLLKQVMEKCGGNYSNIVSVLNQELVGNNAETSGSYMPTDAQMRDFLYNANVYKRPALRIVLDRIELNDNPAPVDLAKLSVEHLMPQTPTDEWLAELDVDEETYLAHLHRLGNLTLAAKTDNSKMGNLQWEYKNEVIKSTAHLKLNMELMTIPKWTIDEIDKRTDALITKICAVFPYPDVIISPKSGNTNDMIVDEKTAKKLAVNYLFSGAGVEEVKKNSVYKTDAGAKGYTLLISKRYPEGDRQKYWFAYRANRFEKIEDCKEQFCVLIGRGASTLVLNIPRSFLDGLCKHLNYSVDGNGNIAHYHIVIHKNPDGRFTLLLSKPTLQRVDITNYLVAEL